VTTSIRPAPKPSQKQARANADATRGTTPRQRAKNTRALEASAALAAREAATPTVGEVLAQAAADAIGLDAALAADSLPCGCAGGAYGHIDSCPTLQPEPVAEPAKAPEPVRTRHASGVTLRDLLAAGIIDAGRVLVAKYKGVTYGAVILADGRVEWKGTAYASPSLAAGMVRMSVIGAPKGYAFPQTNGWTFWHVADANGDLQPLDSLRSGATKTVVAESVPSAGRLPDPAKVAKVRAAKALIDSIDRMPAPDSAKAMGTDEAQAALETVANASLGAARE